MRTQLDSSRWRKTLPWLAAVCLCLLGTMVALADQNATKSDPSRRTAPAVGDLQVPVAGMQVAIDPKTGRLRPLTQEQSRALAEALRQRFRTPSSPLEVIQAENGAVAVQLPEDFDETVLLRTHEDGTETLDCMSATEAARIIAESSALQLPENSSRPAATRGRRAPQQSKSEKE